MSTSEDHAFTAPITIVNSAAFPLPRKKMGVWTAFTIALLVVGLICTSSYALALRLTLDRVEHEKHVLQTQLSTPHQGFPSH